VKLDLSVFVYATTSGTDVGAASAGATRLLCDGMWIVSVKLLLGNKWRRVAAALTVYDLWQLRHRLWENNACLWAYELLNIGGGI
jgi:hypothetical protein